MNDDVLVQWLHAGYSATGNCWYSQLVKIHLSPLAEWISTLHTRSMMDSEAKCAILPKHSLVIFGIFGERHPAPRAAEAEQGVITRYAWEGCSGNAEDCIAVPHPNYSSSADTARWELNQWAGSLKLFYCNFSGLLLTPSVWVIWFTEQSDKQPLWLIRKGKAAVWSERQSR